MICEREHRYIPILENLSESQAGPGRHKCAGCAYEQGQHDAENGDERHLDPRTLDESQAGTGRHIDVQAAYEMGYTLGLGRRRQP